MSKRKVQLETAVDTTGTRKGFAEIKDAAKDAAQGVAQAGQQATKGVEAIGAGADSAAAKVDRATKNMVSQLQRVTAEAQAGSKNAPAYFENRAKQLGIDPAAIQPYLKDLALAQQAQQAAAGSLNSMGMSAKATSAALRQVPAQFTDIIISLQGGQNPLTVFLQQGGQLKDVFGGAGAAARALGGYVLGLVNPFTIAAAAVGVLTYGLYRGSQEGEAFRRTVILTGGAAGVTGNQLGSMAANLAKLTGGTQSRAAELLDSMAQSSAVGAVNMQRFAEAALKLERAGGPAAEETAKAFASLAKSPLESSLKLNESANYLSKAVYEQIRALEMQGKTLEAGKLAQEAYFNVTNERTPLLVNNLGLAERAWKALTDEIKKAGDAVLSVGRGADLDGAIATQAKEARRLRAAASNNGIAKPGELITALTGGPSLDAQATAAERLLKQLQDGKATQNQLALAGAEHAKQLEKGAEWDKQGVQYLTRQKQLVMEIAKAQELGKAAGRPQQEIDDRVAAIRAKFDAGASKGQAVSNLAGIKRELGSLTAAYADAEAILVASRQAGLISEADYYEAKRAFIELDREARVRALVAENADIARADKSGKLTAAEHSANADKIKDNLAKIAEANGKAAASTVVLGVQQTSALSGVEAAYQDARRAAEDYVETLQRGQNRDINQQGAGSRAREISKGRDDILDKYDAERRNIRRERSRLRDVQGGQLTEPQDTGFERRLKLQDEYQEKQLILYDAGVDRRLAGEARWEKGASDSYKDYISGAENIAKQTEQLFTNAFSGAEDALVKFVTTGKGDFKSLADSIIADLVRIAVKQQIVQGLKTAASFFGFADGGAFDPSGEVKRFATGGVFDQPTPFSYGAGKMGVLGEAGPEGVLPLARGAGGKLGVIAHDGGAGGGKSLQLTYAPSILVDGTVDRAKGMADAQKIMRQGQKELLEMLHDKGVY